MKKITLFTVSIVSLILMFLSCDSSGEKIDKNTGTNKFKNTNKIKNNLSSYPKEIHQVVPKAKRVYKNAQGAWEAEFQYGIKMVYIPAKEFKMGSNDEKPVHIVYLDGYWIGKTEVTFVQYNLFCAESGFTSPKDEGWGQGERPVINVDWKNVITYCRWLSKKTGLFFRLPTEAEWEKAARGGNHSKGYKYSGSDKVSEVAWYDKNSGNKTHHVGQKNPNEIGIYDMSGNVSEWCSDWFRETYYQNSPKKNPKGPYTGQGRVTRGGDWYNDAQDAQTAKRFWSWPHVADRIQGFRLALGHK